MGGSCFWFTCDHYFYCSLVAGGCHNIPLSIVQGIWVIVFAPVLHTVDLGHKLAWAAFALGWHCVEYFESGF